jgi:hypothetical protein
MSYEILATAEEVSILHINDANFNSLTGWRIEFHDGKEAMLYYHNGEWMQNDEQWLDEITLQDIGKCIDNSLVKRSPAITEHYFYDMLIN